MNTQVIHPAAGPIDALETAAAAELALLIDAADYLTRQLRNGRELRPLRREAIARERQSIEWTAHGLAIALDEYRMHIDDLGGRA
jgi:hypothetical protein